MTEAAVAEAWIRRRKKRLVNSQKLIQLLAVVTISAPLPLAVLLFQGFFGTGSPIAIQISFASWATVAAVYFAAVGYTRIKQRKL